MGLVEVLHRPTHGVTFQQPPESVAEDVHPFALARAFKRGGPGAVDVPHDRQGAAVGMAEQALGEPGDERARSDLGRPAQRLLLEVVARRSARAVAGEQEGHQPVDMGVGGEIAGGEVVVLGDPQRIVRSRPVLADQRPLARELSRVLRREADAVAGGEEQGGDVGTAQELGELLLVRLVGQVGPEGPALLRLHQGVGQGADELVGGPLGGGVPLVFDAEQGDLPRQPRPELPRLRVDHAPRVPLVVLRGVEVEPPHGVVDVELGLKGERDRLWIADEQQVIRDAVRVGGGAHLGAVALEELRRALPLFVLELPEVGRLAVCRLIAAM